MEFIYDFCLLFSVFSENLVRLRQSMVAASNGIDGVPNFGIKSFLSGDLGAVIISVILLHFAGYLVGYGLPSLSSLTFFFIHELHPSTGSHTTV